MIRIEVTSVTGPAWIQDLGRPGHMHEGVPPGGALVPELLAAANAAVGNPAAAAGIECFGSVRLRAAGGTLSVSLDGARAVAIQPGEERLFATSATQRVSCIAVGGGLDVPSVLGGRGTLLVAGIGGFQGRPLQRGDVIDVGRNEVRAPELKHVYLSPHAAVRVIGGPDLDCFADGAYTTLVNNPWKVLPTSDRIGFRLEGPTLAVRPPPDAPSTPMVQGAIQVPPSGQPIVLGPDHPTSGGYPVLAVVVRADLGRLFARRAGISVRFVAVSPEEARKIRRSG
jgi:biotin-dependent carboxylase-like uncharacterized protein